ncbi:MAG: PQQ-dependent sugar dehydrogenase [Lysobacterales bacterium]
MRPSRPLLLPLLLVSGLTACQPQTDSATPVAASSTAAAPTAPVPTRGERVDSAAGPLELRTIASPLVNPWGLAFLPDGRMLVTERIGQLRIVESDGSLSAPLAGVPAVVAEGQGGLFDVALSPDFAADSLVYLSYAEPGEGKLAGTSVARGRLTERGLADVQVIFQQSPKLDTRHHFGGRLVFDDAGMLYITMGDRGVRPTAQDLSSHMGTVARIHPDGRVPEDNPFVGRDDAQPETWSYGHRNQQGAALNPWTRVLWTNEHGPKGGDEVNIPQAGHNYGWPIITYGINYSGEPIPEAVGTEAPGMEQPHHYWPVSPGISGMAFYDADAIPAWRRSVFIGSLAQMALIRLSLDEAGQVVGEERLLQDQGQRIRDVRVGPDGAVYLLTDNPEGRIWRLGPWPS